MDADPTPDPGPPSRRFAIGDLMVLIVGLALMCAWFARPDVGAWRIEHEAPVPEVIKDGEITWTETVQTEYAWTPPEPVLLESLTVMLLVATTTTLLWRLRSPRPSWGRLARQPGTIACLAALGATLIEAGLWGLGVGLPTSVLVNGGVAVAASWSLLVLARRWRSEPGWIDRLGRLVGVGWIVAAVWVVVETVRPA